MTVAENELFMYRIAVAEGLMKGVCPYLESCFYITLVTKIFHFKSEEFKCVKMLYGYF